MEALLKRAASFPNWSQNPIPDFKLSASGVIALADLGTIAQRTRIVGGSSWLDALLLAPGLHYQQAADAVAGETETSYSAIEMYEGRSSAYNITNSATRRYLERVGMAGQTVTVDVGMMPDRNYNFRGSGRRGQRATIWRDQGADLGWFSHVLYLASPVLTVTAFVFMILLQEWWGVASLLALMLSRVLNIWVIKQRSKPPEAPPPKPDVSSMLTEYLVDLGEGRNICLRGVAEDLQAITTTSWLRAKTHLDGYLEAAAKLIVFVVAAFSGNFTQAGSIIFMLLLLVTAGLLGLSNAHAKTFRMHGRLATPTVDNLPRGTKGAPPYPPSESFGSDSKGGSVSWPATTTRTSSGFTGMSDFAEKGQIGGVLRDRYPFDGLDYR
ncbi:uncharacterized protein F4822DRAFT_425576 [Hypoxylon trugodes]|uniref:uncharacterized protein n=1 Tax=Hypoxylon trugodes TaxID=326681 RepID=UPI0021987C16|nr:uncharacterized protein F4822DRAFT_425576 [Hypoxylon trugodes]KAI1392367.1 hypothetical protein F4822DRAFT_425576 [Hypoxylon trugodes]